MKGDVKIINYLNKLVGNEVLYLESFAEFSDHSVIEIGTIVRNDSFRDAVPTDQIMPNEPCHNILGYSGVRSCFNPLCKLIDRYQDEVMPIGCRRFNFTDHIYAPHCKRPRCSQDIQRNWRNVHLICINLAFVTYPSLGK